VYALLYSERWDQSYPELLFGLGLRLGEVRPPLSRPYMPHEWIEYQAEATRVKPTIKLPPEVYPTFAIVERQATKKKVICVDHSEGRIEPSSGLTVKSVYLHVTGSPVDWDSFDTADATHAWKTALTLSKSVDRTGANCLGSTTLVRVDGLVR
jgi:hypothetical protein